MRVCCSDYHSFDDNFYTWRRCLRHWRKQVNLAAGPNSVGPRHWFKFRSDNFSDKQKLM